MDETASSRGGVSSALKAQLLEAEQRYPGQLAKDDYLALALECAELSMKSLKLADDAQEKSRIRSGCNALLVEADRAKKSSHFDPASASVLIEVAFPEGSLGPVKPLHVPVSSRMAPKSEQILLWRGSKLNGHTFPPWEGPPKPEEFALPADGQLFTDSAQIPLSPEQQDILDAWKRPSEAMPPPNWSLAFPDSQVEYSLGPSMALKPGVKVDLVQDAAPDCSVVASFSAGISRGERGHPRILAKVIYPFDHPMGVAKPSPNGKYILCLNFNGCSRKVVIDDRLPVSKTKRLLHVTDRNFPNLLWPALLEKAYLKVRGGYDFPGSNSGTDIWIILGWIPEQVFLQHEDTNEDILWKRFISSHRFGDVLITLGTSRITPEVESESGLAGDHDYAVLDAKEEDGQRLLLVKNPWLKATAWKGLSKDSYGKVGSESLSAGTFWMSMHAVMQNFMTMYLNWNPGLFRHRQDFHFTWDLSATARSPPGSIINNPQYTLRSATADTVWLLVSRHFKDRPADSPPVADSPHAQNREDEAFISIYSFQGKDRRVYQSRGASDNSLYVDAPQTLLRLDVPANVPYTLAIMEQHLPATLHTFTLFAFSRQPLIMDRATPQHTSRVTVSGAWTSQTAGGTPSTATYGINPQYVLHLPTPSRVTLVLENPSSTLSVNVALAHAEGARVHALRTRDIAASSGPDYRRGCALASTPSALPAGTYTVIASTFDAGQTGEFVLHADTDCERTTLRALPREGAGLLRFNVPEATFAPGARRLVARLSVARLTRVRFAARHVVNADAAPPSPLRLAVEVQGPDGEPRVLADSCDGRDLGSAYSDAAAGVRVPDVDLQPAGGRGSAWLLLERLGGGVASSTPSPGSSTHGASHGPTRGDSGSSGGRGLEEGVAVEGFCDGLPGGVAVGAWEQVE